MRSARRSAEARRKAKIILAPNVIPRRWTIDSALEDDLVTVVERNDAEGTYRIRIGELRTVVTIRLKTKRGVRWTTFTQSHAIKTPEQIGAYWTSRPGNDTPGSALHQAVSSLTMYYGSAVKLGHQPSEDWLEPG